MNLKDKKIVLGVTGSIGAYKALELTRLLKKEGAVVWPVMTASAKEFISKLSLSTLAGVPVQDTLFGLTDESGINHIDLADGPDLILVAPATANTIGKIAGGLCDDLLTTTIMASKAPVLIAPAMNDNMYSNPIVEGNMRKLKEVGYGFVEPAFGPLACGHVGMGRLADPPHIVEACKEALSQKDLAGERVLVTAGPTREEIDPVRFISNKSSGRMGYEVARVLRARGASVTLISGPVDIEPPYGVRVVGVLTAEEMYTSVMDNLGDSTAVVMAAAVADFRPKVRYDSKVKKEVEVGSDHHNPLESIETESTIDILKEVGKIKGDRVVIGFALETDDLIENGGKKLKTKNLDMVVINSPEGINGSTNKVVFLERGTGTLTAGQPCKPYKIEELPLLEKSEVAERIADSLVGLRGVAPPTEDITEGGDDGNVIPLKVST